MLLIKRQRTFDVTDSQNYVVEHGSPLQIIVLRQPGGRAYEKDAGPDLAGAGTPFPREALCVIEKKLDLLSIFPTPNDYRMNYPARKARKSV